MHKLKLAACKREDTGKGAARKARALGRIPAILYGKGEEPSWLTLDQHEFTNLIHRHKDEQFLINLTVEGESPKNGEENLTIVKDIQVDPVRGDFIHADLLRVALDKPLHTEVPIHLVGRAPGIALGGILDFQHRSVEVSCLPMSIPDFIEVDISSLDIGNTIHISDIKLSGEIKILTDPSQAVCTVAQPIVSTEKKEDEAGGVEGAEADKGAE